MSGHRRGTGKPLGAVATVQRRAEMFRQRRRDARSAKAELGAGYGFLLAVAADHPEAADAFLTAATDHLFTLAARLGTETR